MIQFDSFMQAEGVPIYQQIIRYVKQGIAAGTIRDGEELPSRRVLSALLAVNPNTVQKAYRMMEEEGLVESHTGAKSCVHADAGRVDRDGAACHGPQHEAHGAGQAECLEPV